MDIPTFRARFPFFANVNPLMVAVVIQEATNQVDASVFRQNTDAAIGYLAAHLLAIDPQGSDTRLVAKDGSTMYGKMYENLRLAMTVGIAVSGGGDGCGRGGGWPG